MCAIEVKLTTENEDHQATENAIDINHSATLACISAGIGYSELEEISAAINMPMMAYETYAANEADVAAIMCQTAWKTMGEAAVEEASLARALGEVDSDGIPCITVVTDGAWSKRSYNVNYDALSGVACIIGQRTGKLLFLAVRNKYCSICARTVGSKSIPSEHLCFRNWAGPSTAMETDIIAEGFKRSLDMHGIKYTRMVGDGDSSVYRKLKEVKPYGNQLVEKVECRNHLLRNFSSKLRELTNQDYGPNANNNPDMTHEEYAAEQEKFLKDLQKSPQQITAIEEETRSQSASQKWKQERHLRLTASNFGEICRMRSTTSCQNMVKRLLYCTFKGNRYTRWGTEHESLAIEEFELKYGFTVSKCGFFIDKTHYYLGASPDGLIDNNALIEVKCPANCVDVSPEEGIERKLIKFAEMKQNKMYLKRTHPYFYQVQGQLAITQKDVCFFVIWTPKGIMVEEVIKISILRSL
ncbi:hypothetical protein GEV33_015102 [Tenebrio molitor]|uniref:YqaJ viral recombinase domain-containing protein n=1 Tax=Tenebrio molitor TaxID=7067 RepID=A0A8J6H3N0_TENMO|nr:hypothetical protein GEV33_015102 [Tenebrio molitor]